MSNTINVKCTVTSNVHGTEVYALGIANVNYNVSTQVNINSFREFLITHKGKANYDGIVKLTSNVTGQTVHQGKANETFEGTLAHAFEDVDSDTDASIVVREDYTNYVYSAVNDGINRSLWTINPLTLGNKIKSTLADATTRTFVVQKDDTVDAMPSKTPWILVCNYVRTGNSNPSLNSRTTAADSGLPVENNTFKDVNINSTIPNETTNTGYGESWGHAGNDLFDMLCTAMGTTGFELRFLAKNNGSKGTLVHYKTSLAVMLAYFRTGRTTSNWREYWSTVTLYDSAFTGTGIESWNRHTSGWPNAGTTAFENVTNVAQWPFDEAMTNFPLYGGSPYGHWGVRGHGTRWEVAGGSTADNTFHQVWVRCDK